MLAVRIVTQGRSSSKPIVAAYVQARLRQETDAERGRAAEIARRTGFSSAHVANAKNHGTVGEDFAEAMATLWGMTHEQLRDAAKQGFGKAPATPTPPARTVELDPTAGPEFRNVPGWREAVEETKLRYRHYPDDAYEEAGAMAGFNRPPVMTAEIMLQLLGTVMAIRAARARGMSAEQAAIVAKMDTDEAEADRAYEQKRAKAKR